MGVYTTCDVIYFIADSLSKQVLASTIDALKISKNDLLLISIISKNIFSKNWKK